MDCSILWKESITLVLGTTIIDANTMTANHLLLNDLAELMLTEQQNRLPVDCLFDDEHIHTNKI